MALSSTKIKVGEHEVEITALPARRSLMFKTKLIKRFGPSFSKLFSSVSMDGGKVNVENLGGFVQAIEKLCQDLDPQEFLDLVTEAFEFTHVNGIHVGNETGFDQIFTGDIQLIYVVLFHTLKYNYKSFFEKGGIGNRLKKVMEG